MSDKGQINYIFYSADGRRIEIRCFLLSQRKHAFVSASEPITNDIHKAQAIPLMPKIKAGVPVDDQIMIDFACSNNYNLAKITEDGTEILCTEAPEVENCELSDWDLIPAPEVKNYRKLSYGDGVWIGVGDGSITNSIIRSTDDGQSWDLITVPENNAWQSVKFGNGVFVALASSGTNRIMRSTDLGLTWTVVQSPEQNSLFCLGYGNGVWIAGAQNGTDRIIRSTDDGLTWTPINIGSILPFEIAYGDGVWVILGSFFHIRSTDGGLTWNNIITIDSIQWKGVHFNDGVFIGISSSGTNRIGRSTDGGLTWTPIAAPQTGIYQSITYGKGFWIGIGNARIIASDDDGLSWFSMTLPAESNNWTTVSFGDDAFCAASASGTNRIIRNELICS